MTQLKTISFGQKLSLTTWFHFPINIYIYRKGLYTVDKPIKVSELSQRTEVYFSVLSFFGFRLGTLLLAKVIGRLLTAKFSSLSSLFTIFHLDQQLLLHSFCCELTSLFCMGSGVCICIGAEGGIQQQSVLSSHQISPGIKFRSSCSVASTFTVSAICHLCYFTLYGHSQCFEIPNFFGFVPVLEHL